MKKQLNIRWTFTAMVLALCPLAAQGQSTKDASLDLAVQQSPAAQPGTASHASAPPVRGPHGGTLRLNAGLQLETVVTQGGIQLFVFDRGGQPLDVEQGRGAVSLRVEGQAKRYRYDLLPDGQGSLRAAVNLSAVAGLQLEMDIQLVGLPASTASPLSLHEVASVPTTALQQVAAAVARQKTCPVSGKPLGSMGDPLAVDVAGQQVYVCCAACVNAVRANPQTYAAGRPPVTVATASAADARLIAAQAKCPVMDEPLGSMGKPVKVMVAGKPIFLCCKGCIKKVEAEPAKYLALVHGAQRQATVAAGQEQVRPGVFAVTAADAPYIAAQQQCPVMDEPLAVMGGPYKVNADGQAIYICCPGCAKKIAAEPQKYLAILTQKGIQPPLLK
ncbi:MAG: hypothetical protein KDA45_13435 [Planctomycetales bacterium]|nr:hypothetical protein [Planctomycetales bacterium]